MSNEHGQAIRSRSVIGLEADNQEEAAEYVDMSRKDALIGNYLDANWAGRGRLFRITKIRNRLDPEYDGYESAGYRDMSINVEVCANPWRVSVLLARFEPGNIRLVPACADWASDALP